jgi:sugar lactone lactonase YvrE
MTATLANRSFHFLLSAILIVACEVSSHAAERVVLIAGGDKPNAEDATQVKLNEPFAVDINRDGVLYLVEMTGHRLSRVSGNGAFTPLAGNGKPGNGGDGGPAAQAQLNGPHAIAISKTGDVYIADTFNNRVRRFDPGSGEIHAFAGTGKKGFSGDGGPAAEAQFGGVYCIAFDASGRRMLMADLDNRRIRAIDMSTGVVTTVAGNGQKGVPKDSAEAAQSPLVDPRAVAVDEHDNIYILERGGHALRVVDSKGAIRTVAGAGKPGLAGDGDDAIKAQLNGPKHLCIDRDGSVLIADTENHVIRRYDSKSGKITRVAGTGKQGRAGLNGPPLEIELDRPHGVYVAADGALYIADSSNGRILKIERE